MSLPQMRHAPSPDGGPIHAAGLRPVRCLLMDDSQFDRRRVMHTAQRAGLRMDVVEAATIAEARDLLTSNDFALCVFDYYLPDGDGIRFAEEVLHNPDRRPVPTIILSGRGTQETPRTAL
ncbi:MAG: response regulator, partial [Pseudomonadota bacterium]